MFNKCIIFIAFFVFSIFTLHAQKVSNTYEQSNYQFSLRIGSLNASLTNEFKIAPKVNLSIDAGVALSYFYSERGVYDKYNHQYSKYNDEGDQFLNFGSAPYWCAYTDATLKYLFNQNSKVKYNSTTKVNTFAYLAVQLRANSVQISPAFSDNPLDKYRETYRIGFLVGRQLAFTKDATFFYDISTGIGITTNYKFETVAPLPIISIKLGANLFKI